MTGRVVSAVTTLSTVLMLVPLFCMAQTPPVNLDFGPDDNDEAPLSVPLDREAALKRAEKMRADGLRVRYVTVKGRWSRNVQLPLVPGELLTPESLSAAMGALSVAINSEAVAGYGLRSMGEIGVLFIQVEFDSGAADGAQADSRTVGVIFHPYVVRLTLQRVGDNVLPIPRSPYPTFYDNAPKALLALNPRFGASYDRAFGSAVGAEIQADLFNLGESKGGAPNNGRHLDVYARGSQSLEEHFHRGNAGVRYSAQPTDSNVREWNARANYDGEKKPLGDADHTHEAVLGGVGVTLKLAPTTRVSLDTGYSRTDDSVDSDTAGGRIQSSAHEQTNRILLDSLPPPIYGFARAAVWENNTWLNGGGSSYQRLVGRVGYAKEIPLQLNHSIGVELVAGAGKSWGNVPDYAKFFGGNSPSQFLYDAPASSALLAMPDGPLIRSFGESQAGILSTNRTAAGGNRFWHINMNLTVPIRRWSRPLIPDELTDLPDANGNPTTIKDVIKKQVNVTGPAMLTAVLKKEGISTQEATAKAKSILDEVRPAVDFVVDEANIYSIKPLLMFDVAGLSDSNGSSNTWVAAGAGVQVIVVTARFEGGYMRTLSGPTFGERGNLFLRLVFQNLF